ncbi:hypothetical protein [Pedobacter panaciterrae]
MGYNKCYTMLASKKILFDFVYDVLASRYSAPFIEQNLATFNVSEADYRDLLKYIQNRNVVVDQKQLASAKPLILNDMKVLLCKYHLGDAGYYKALNLSDAMVKQALNSLQ